MLNKASKIEKLLNITNRFCIPFLLALGAFQALSGQANGELSGFVYDRDNGLPLIGANITIDGSGIGTISDENGYFYFESIQTGTYTVAASYLGYESFTTYNVIVKSRGTPELVIRLQEQATILEGVTIVPNPFEKTTSTPLSIQKLSLDEIASYPGGNNDVTKVIQSFPGVSGSIGGFRNDVILRGGGPSESVFYLDGIEVPNINHFATQGAGGGPVSLLNVSFFEGVTLTTSAFDAKYDNALSGILQFDQRRGNPRQVGANIRVSGTETALTLEGPLFKRSLESSQTSYLFSIRRSYLQLLFKLLDLPFLPDYWDYQFKINHKIDDNNSIDIIGLGSIDDFSINIPDDLSEEAQSQLDQSPVIRQKTNTTGISWNHRFDEGNGLLTMSLSSNYLDNNLFRYVDNSTETGLFFSNEARELETKWRTDVTRFFDNVKLSFGATIQNVDYTNTTIDQTNDFTFNSDLNFFRYGLYGQLSTKFANGRIKPSVGLRADGNTMTEGGHELYRTLSPRFGLAIVLDESQKWTLNLSAGRYARLPSNTILGFQDNNGDYINQDADYIISNHLVGGIEFLPRISTRLTLEGFYKMYQQYPVSVNKGVSLANLGGDFEVFGNEPVSSDGKGRAYGLEVLFQQKLSRNFFAIFAYTLYWSEFTKGNTSDYFPSFWDNRHLVTFTGGYKFGKNWELGVKYRFQGGAPYAPVNQEATLEVYPDIVLDYGLIGTQRLGSFQSLDVRLDKKINFNKWSFEFFLDIQNAMGTQSPQPPVFGLVRTQTGEVKTPRELKEIMDIDQGQLIPTLGIVIDF